MNKKLFLGKQINIKSVLKKFGLPTCTDHLHVGTLSPLKTKEIRKELEFIGDNVYDFRNEIDMCLSLDIPWGSRIVRRNVKNENFNNWRHQ